MISSLEWVPAGIADPNPKKYELNAAEQEELIRMMEQGAKIQQEMETNKQETSKRNKKSTSSSDNTLPADLRMDEYSDDDDDDDDAGDEHNNARLGKLLLGNSTSLGQQSFGKRDLHGGNDDSEDSDDDDDKEEKNEEMEQDEEAGVGDTREFEPLDVQGLAAMGLGGPGNGVFNENYIMNDEDDDNDSDLEDVRLNPNDAMIVVAKTEDDFPSLEVHVYDQDTGNLYVHHDVPLPSFPLCLAHGDVAHETSGNYCAVGSFSTDIEIWNLDVLNPLEPTCILGATPTQKNSQHQHSDACMSLSWNSIHRQVIASGSADNTVKLWDVTKPEFCQTTMTHHKDKVESVVWHPTEGTLLATGSYDQTVAIVNAQDPTNNVQKLQLSADVESIAWDPIRSHYLTAASEDGVISTWDVRQLSSSNNNNKKQNKPIWSLRHNMGVSDITYNRHVPGMLVSCSVDQTIQLWDTNQPNAVKQVGEKDMGVGKLFKTSFYPSAPWLLACAGSGNQLSLWDMRQDEKIQSIFGKYYKSNTSNETATPNNNDANSIMQFKTKNNNASNNSNGGDQKQQQEQQQQSKNTKNKKKPRGKKKSKAAHKRR